VASPTQQAAALKAVIDLAAAQAAEVAAQRSTTPAAGKIPVAGEDGKLADGWVEGGGGSTQVPWLLKTTTEMNAIASPTEGMAVWNTTEHQLYVYDGIGWHGVPMQA